MKPAGVILRGPLLQTPHEFLSIRNVDYSVGLLNEP